MPTAARETLSSAALAALGRRPTVPSWLISMVVHLAAMLILALSFTKPTPGFRGSLSVEMGFAEAGSSQGEPTGVTIIPAAAGGASSAAADGRTAAVSPPVTTLADALGGALPVDPTAALPSAVAVTGAAMEGSGVGRAKGSEGGRGGSGKGFGSGGSGTGGIGQGVTTFYDIPGEGSKFVYVLDRSASMGGSGRNALEAAKAELLASIDQLDKVHQFQILFYNEQVFKFNPTGDPNRLVFATAQNKALARRFVASITADDGTKHEEALTAAIKLQPDVIFFLTDADEPKLWPAQLFKIHNMAKSITINTIEFGFGPQADPDNFLIKLARENGGRHAYFDISKLLAGR